MGLISKTTITKWNSRNKRYYEFRGYTYSKMNDVFEVKVEDLSAGNKSLVDIECNNCKNISTTVWKNYLKIVQDEGKCYCNKCSVKLYGTENMRKIKLIKGLSFEQWCIENNRQDVLDRWDYELNNCKPSDIGFSAKGKFWFKCPFGVHESELKMISSITGNKRTGNLDCNKCVSFAQYLINLYGENALQMYWDYDLNIDADPWILRKNSITKVFIKCQDNEKNHESYFVQCSSFTSMDSRCPRCSESKMEIEIGLILDNMNVLYTTQKTFKSCSYEKLLRFDFYLNDFNICIEAQGIQHYKPIDFAGKGIDWAEKQFIGSQIKDNIKRDFCKDNFINLLEIKYIDYDNIKTILSQQLNIPIQEAI